MTGLVRKATFFVACATLFGAVAAFAGIVSPANCTVGATRINLVGFNAAASGDQADSTASLSKLTITVRDLVNSPIAGVPVVLDFSGCTSDVKVASTQSYHAQTAGCSTATVQGYTTSNGTVSFVVIGGRSAATAHAAGCAKVYADSYLLGSLSVGTFDQNNIGGMTLADVSYFWGDVASGSFHDRTDINGDGILSLADVAYGWGANGHFNTSGAVLCP
jgi:hypothetical protein